MQNEDEGTCKWCPHNIFKNHALVSVNRGGGDPRGIEGDSVIINEILSECPKGFNNVSLEKGLMYFYVGNQDKMIINLFPIICWGLRPWPQ